MMKIKKIRGQTVIFPDNGRSLRRKDSRVSANNIFAAYLDADDSPDNWEECDFVEQTAEQRLDYLASPQYE